MEGKRQKVQTARQVGVCTCKKFTESFQLTVRAPNRIISDYSKMTGTQSLAKGAVSHIQPLARVKTSRHMVYFSAVFVLRPLMVHIVQSIKLRVQTPTFIAHFPCSHFSTERCAASQSGRNPYTPIKTRLIWKFQIGGAQSEIMGAKSQKIL